MTFGKHWRFFWYGWLVYNQIAPGQAGRGFQGGFSLRQNSYP
jgi:hypothetical protein